MNTNVRFDRSGRLIIRNLAFNTKKEDLEVLCSKIGPFSEVAVPPCKDKRFPKSCAGFAFVNFNKKADAAKAKEQLNFTQFKGRKIAVDWAINKDEYMTNVINAKKDDSKPKDVKEKPAAKPEKKNEAEDDGSDEDSDGDDEGKAEDDDFLRGSDEEVEDAEGDSDEDEDDADEQEEQEEPEPQPSQKNPKKRKDDSAVKEGRALFLRNLSFNTTNDALKEEFSEFGDVQLAITCCFADSDHSRGTAFVHFKTKEAADAALNAMNSNEGLTIDGRRVNGVLAVDRREASQFQNKAAGEKKVKDKRNLYLLRASVIRPGTDAANDMSQHDADKRQKLASQSKKKLQNLLMFVSPNRLIIYNVPTNMKDNTLKDKCLVATGNKDARITECKIWRDMEKLDSRGLPVSLGFAFVGFSEHDDALKCLKNMNNNPKTFTNEKRPIVDFCVENLTAVRAKERSLMKSKLPQGTDMKKIATKKEEPKVDMALEKTKSILSQGGQKALPKRFDVKRRHRDANDKMKAKRKANRKRKSVVDGGLKSAKNRKLNTKGVTKSLTMT